MARKRYSPEQIIDYLREAEVLLAKENTIGQVCRKIGITSRPIIVDGEIMEV